MDLKILEKYLIITAYIIELSKIFKNKYFFF